MCRSLIDNSNFIYIAHFIFSFMSSIKTKSSFALFGFDPRFEQLSALDSLFYQKPVQTF